MASAFLLVPLTLLLLCVLLVVLRLRQILDPRRAKPLRHGHRNALEPTHLLIVLGSGGHTAEMIAMMERAIMSRDPVERLDWKDYGHRTWVVGSGDGISAQRAKAFEELATRLSTQEAQMEGDMKRATDNGAGSYEIVTVPRARQIHQPLYTAPLSSARCMLACARLLMRAPTVPAKADFPDLVLCNGPATATILVFTSILLRFANFRNCNGRGKMRTVYVESWARVKKLSLSGVLLSRIVDRFIVQWPQLQSSSATGGKAEYMGVLV